MSSVPLIRNVFALEGKKCYILYTHVVARVVDVVDAASLFARAGGQGTRLRLHAPLPASPGCCFADGHPGAIIAASGKLKDRHLLTHEDDFQQEITAQLQRYGGGNLLHSLLAAPENVVQAVARNSRTRIFVVRDCRQHDCRQIVRVG